MAGFGGELILFCALGYVLLGPKRMHSVLEHIARAKREFDKTRRAVQAQLSATPEARSDDPSS